ncbi:hypothetical protein APR41_10520 [Salegentibacter salinarum]|uniref:Glycosyl transferase family 1 n=2 Tax=Salegentibacter salinarum TaxID=447422 RepID=A0A2N0TN98_9FLAO|nr:hypothetical protein APR41_10520 [Salegentibacter salinarum]
MTTDTIGGVWVYSMHLCQYLSKFGTEVILLSFGGNPSSDQLDEVQAIENLKYYPTTYKLEWMENPWEDVEKAHIYVKQLCELHKPDVIHLSNFMDLENILTPIVNVYHSCVLSWWESVKGNPAPEEWLRYKELVQASLKNADIVVGPTQSILKSARELYGNDFHGICIPNATDYNYPEEDKQEFILCAGRIWDDAKNLKLLETIAPKLSYPVVVAGSNEHPNNGEKLNIENVIFLGRLPQKELLKWMSKSAIFFSPVLYEPFGLTILEAARSRCALVISNIDTLKENWSHAAIFFDPRIPVQALEALNKLIANSRYRQHLGKVAYNRSNKFSSEKSTRTYLDIYKKLNKVNQLLKLNL